MLVFACLTPMLVASINYFRSHAGAAVTAVVATYACILLRSWLIWAAGDLYRWRRWAWMGLMYAGVLTPIAMWDVFYCIFAASSGAEAWDALLVLLCMVCTAFGAVHSFTSELRLMLAYQYVMLAGPAAITGLTNSPHHWMIAASIGVLLVFSTMQGEVMHQQYWNGLKDQDSLREAIREARSANEAKSAFLANMSHEIRTPLNGLLGMIAVTLESGLSGRQREQLEMAQQSGLLLCGILNDILDLSKIEAGKVMLESADFDLEASLDDLIRLAAPRAAQKGLKIHLDYGSGIPRWFRGDGGKLRQIALNYIENALKFTAEGGITVMVTAARANSPAMEVTLAVRDTGIGISPGQQAKLFEKFSQADESTTRLYGGTGLGLVICKRLAEVMGGSVGVTSAAGRGSTFRATVPLQAVEPPSRGANEAARNARPARELRGKVLLAEDNPVNQMFMTRLLARRGLTVDIAEDGQAAVDMSLATRYSIVFMDCQMPKMDGYQAAREIRAREEQSAAGRMPIVAMTANAMSGDRERCLEAGMDDYLSKPVAVDDLERLLHQWSDKRTGELK